MSALSAIARQEYYVELGNSLPPPIRDNPEHLEHRFATAIETFEALRPGDAYEARLAVQIVLTGAHAAESLREAGLYRDDFAKRTRCRAQAASMMHEEHAAKRMLAQEQKLRLATQTVANAANPQPAAAAAAQPPAPAAVPPPAPAAVPPPAPAAVPPPAPVPPTAAPVPPAAKPLRPVAAQAAPPAPAPAPAESAPPPSPEAVAKAEAFAQAHVVAAAQIRHDRGVTPQHKARFRPLALPTDPMVIDALVHGSSDVLALLDEIGGETMDAAA